MLFTIFAVYDVGTNSWKAPFFGIRKGEVLREFGDAVENPQSYLGKHPQHYALFELGTFDDDKCKFDLLSSPIRLCLAMDYVKSPAAGSGGGLGASPQERSAATGALSDGPKIVARESGSK